MASTKIKIKYKTKWAKEEPSGQVCFVCGDKCYLLPVRRAKMITYPSKSIHTLTGPVCDSCFNKADIQE